MTPGSQIAHYRITSKLGEGGMGAVYRATDTKLNRDVAIKVLPESYAHDADRLTRFTREAQVLAGLNHPNIAAIYGVEDRALVLELVEGAEPRGPLSAAQALPVIRQLIDALEYAHDKGIVHRDLKPANLKVTPQGNLKVLDFGLAKALASDAAGAAPDAANSPTLTIRATMAGIIMGTAAYMSPEQARGQNTDRRSDIWSFGVIVHELLTGRRLFDSPTISDTLAAVLAREPDLSAVPPRFHRLLKLCLVRDSRERLSHISAARLLLDESDAPRAQAVTASKLPWVVAAVLLLALAASLWTSWREPASAALRPMVQMDLETGQEAQHPAISPDGLRVAFVTRDSKNSHLATRLLDQTRIATLPETEGALRPFFSPDGRSIGFFAGGKLKRLALDGGAPVVLADAEYPGGGMWGEDGTIAAVLGQWTTSIVYRIPAVGGSPQPWTTRDPNGEQQAAPHLLPGGKALAFTSRGWNAGYRYALRVASPGKQDSTKLLEDASGGRYLDGYLVFYRQGKLFAAPFDAQRLKITGEAIPMVDEVAESEGLPQFDLSSSGTLVYRRGRETGRVVIRMNPSGKIEKITPAPGGFITPRFSPDGKRLAVVDLSGAQPRILIYDLARGVANRLTLDDRTQNTPSWTPDGQYVVYQSTETMLAVRADGAGQPEPFLSKAERTSLSFSRDGKRAVGTRHNTETNRGEIWIAPVENTATGLRFGTPVTVSTSPGFQEEAVFSPDGRFIAYMSNERGIYQIYVASLTPDGRAAGGKWQISNPTGYNPVWPAAGGQIFYDDGISGQIHVVSYTANGDAFAAAPPHPWSPTPLSHYMAKMYDVADDGKQMVGIPESDSAPPETHLRLILNFGDELRRRFRGAAR